MKYFPRTVPSSKETEVTGSCFLGLSHKYSEFSLHDSILGPCSNRLGAHVALGWSYKATSARIGISGLDMSLQMTVGHTHCTVP